jgi:hypothetical protein
MNKKDVNEKDVDEKLINWNSIFEELVIDVKTLIRDLSESINYIAVSALIAMLMGVAALAIGINRVETKYVAAGLIIFSILAGNGFMTLRKWHTMRKRYDRLKSLQKEMEHK